MCGLFGSVAQRAKKLNKRAICVMGSRNDSRGGDSCGLFIDGEVEYGVKDSKLFIDFFRDSVLLNTTDRCQIVLGHCRKASVGKVGLETAQPVVLKNSNDQVEFVLIHNGTIHNYEDLAKKYIPDVDITGLTDSQVMARIFYHKGYDCLDEYVGGAVFIMHDYRINKTLAFKGSSKKFNASKNAEEERPLYYCWHNDKFMFSSIFESLYAYYYEESVFNFPSNKLIQIGKNKLYKIKEYKREQMCQTKPIVSTYNLYTQQYSEGFLIKFDENRRFCDNSKKQLHGIYSVASYGWVYPNFKGKGITYEVAFFNGIMLKHPKAFHLLEKRIVNGKLTKEGQTLLNLMDFNPFSSDGKQFYWFNYNQLLIPTQNWKIPFGDIVYHFDDNGCLKSTSKGSYNGWAFDYANYVYDEKTIIARLNELCKEV